MDKRTDKIDPPSKRAVGGWISGPGTGVSNVIDSPEHGLDLVAPRRARIWNWLRSNKTEAGQ